MIKSISEWIVISMVRNDIIAEVDAPIQRYGLELVFSLVITALMLMLLTIISHRTLEIIWAVAPFCILRGFSGGWHANTHLKCITLFMAMIITELIVMPTVVGTLLMSQSITMTLLMISLISVFTFAPVASETKPLSEKEVARYRVMSRMTVVVILGCNVLTYFYLSPLLGTLGVVSTTFQSLSLIPHALSKENMTFEE